MMQESCQRGADNTVDRADTRGAPGGPQPNVADPCEIAGWDVYNALIVPSANQEDAGKESDAASGNFRSELQSWAFVSDRDLHRISWFPVTIQEDVTRLEHTRLGMLIETFGVAFIVFGVHVAMAGGILIGGLAIGAGIIGWRFILHRRYSEATAEACIGKHEPSPGK